MSNTSNSANGSLWTPEDNISLQYLRPQKNVSNPFQATLWAATNGGVTWETDFYTPPVLGGAALLPFSAPAVYKNPVP